MMTKKHSHIIPNVKRIIPFIPVEGECTIKSHYERYQLSLLHCECKKNAQGVTAKHSIIVETGKNNNFIILFNKYNLTYIS